MTAFFQNVVNALQWGSFYALIALGYSMVYGVLLLFNFAHGDIFMVGAYIGFFVATAFLAMFGAAAGLIALPSWLILVLVILATMFLTSFLGMAVERIGYRPLRNAPRASAAITGLMIGIILETAILAIFGAQRMKFPDLLPALSSAAQPIIGGVIISWQKILIVVVSIVLMLLLQWFVSNTKWGMAMRAMAYDFAAVPLMGVPLNRIASLTFALGSALAGAAAVLYSMAYPVLDPYMGITVGWKAFVAAILGGRGSIKGAAIAGFMLGFIEIFSATLFPSTYRDLIAYSIILIILVFRPHGLFGEEHTSKLRL
jgi:branched-chain amino acid transport system permease protein